MITLLSVRLAHAEPSLRLELEPGVVPERKFDTDAEAVVPRVLKLPPDDAVFTEFVWIPKSWLTAPPTRTVAELAEQDAGIVGDGAVLRKSLESARSDADLVTRAAAVMAILRAGSSSPQLAANQRLRPLWECLADSPETSSLDAAFHTMAVMHAISHEVGLARVGVGPGSALVTLLPGTGPGCAPTDDQAGRCALGAAVQAGPLHVAASWALTEVTKPGWSPYTTPPPAPPPSSGGLPASGPAWLARRTDVCEQAAALGLKCVERSASTADEPAAPSSGQDDMYLALSGVTGLFLIGSMGKFIADRRRRNRVREQRQADQRKRRF